MGWGEDLRRPFGDNTGSATAARWRLFEVCDILVETVVGSHNVLFQQARPLHYTTVLLAYLLTYLLTYSLV